MNCPPWSLEIMRQPRSVLTKNSFGPAVTMPVSSIRIKSGCWTRAGTGRAVLSSNPYRLVPKVEGEQPRSFLGRGIIVREARFWGRVPQLRRMYTQGMLRGCPPVPAVGQCGLVDLDQKSLRYIDHLLLPSPKREVVQVFILTGLGKLRGERTRAGNQKMGAQSRVSQGDGDRSDPRSFPLVFCRKAKEINRSFASPPTPPHHSNFTLLLLVCSGARLFSTKFPVLFFI